MDTFWGLVVALLGSVAWFSQGFALIAPSAAARLGIGPDKKTADPGYWASSRGTALWDVLTLWPMIVAGILLMTGDPVWAYFGLVGGATYLYSGGQGFWALLAMGRHRLDFGANAGVRLVLLALMAALGTATLVGGLVALSAS